MKRTNLIESVARDAHYQSILEQSEESLVDDFVHVPAPALSQTSVEELSRQVDLLEGNASFFTRLLLKPKLPGEVQKEIQTQIVIYAQISHQNKHIQTHLDYLKVLDLRLQQTQLLGSLTPNIDPREIPVKFSLLEELKTEWQSFKPTVAKNNLEVLDKRKSALEKHAHQKTLLKDKNRARTQKFIEQALNPQNIPYGFTASFGSSSEKIASTLGR